MQQCVRKKCNMFLGSMEVGKILKTAIFLCTECHDAYKTHESLANYNKSVGNEPKVDMPDFFKDMFK